MVQNRNDEVKAEPTTVEIGQEIDFEAERQKYSIC